MAGNRFWLNAVLDKIEAAYPSGEVIVSSGISASASYHIGHFREILSADLIKVGLEQRGRQAKHLHVVDNFDPLRKRYDFLPPEYEKYVGWPVCLVPDPKGCHDSYAEHFFQEFYQWIPKLNVEAEVIRSYQDLYKSGKMAGQIETALENIELIKRILKDLSNRDLESDWAPIQILSDNNSFNDWQFMALDKDKKQIKYKGKQGQIGWVDYDNGRVKLNWRIDWPARWQILGVMVEPHGRQEHGAAGGSYQTGMKLAKEVFGFNGPLAGIQYGHVHLAGETTKMSSSKGNLITPEQAFSIMPPEMLRYFYARYPGKKRIDFDPGLGLYRMMDEFAQVSHDVGAGRPNEFEPAYNLAVAGSKQVAISSIPFNHLVSVFQAALGKTDQVLAILRRTGYGREVETQRQAIINEMKYVKNWLENWAPPQVKFKLLETLPKPRLSPKQKEFLSSLAESLKPNQDGKWYHEQIHAAREASGCEIRDAFGALYQVLIGQDSGPKAGWFLSILDYDWLIKRLKLES